MRRIIRVYSLFLDMTYNVVLGGTFNPIHAGHRNLLEKALSTGDTVIGITSDEMARASRDRKVEDYEIREERVREVAQEMADEYDSDFRIDKLTEPSGPAVENGEFEYIVISPEDKTIHRVNEINEKRNQKGHPPLKIKVADPIYAEDGKRISSTRIVNGEIDKQGNLVKNEKQIAIVNDIHYGHPEVDNEAILEELRKVIKELEDKRLIIVNGDIIHGESEEKDEERLKTVVDMFPSEKTYFLPGNHDVINLSRETFEEIAGNSTVDSISMSEKVNLHFVDSASASEIENVGLISEDSFELVTNLDNPEDTHYIFSHFPLEYTTKYRESKHFNRYPEGVFPVNKFMYEKIEIGDYVDCQYFAHLHSPSKFTSRGINNEVIGPFTNLDDYVPEGNYKILTVDF